jgi:hypothetical protein
MNERSELQGFSVAATRIVVNGQVRPVAAGEGRPYSPPPPVETPMRLMVDGEVMAPSAVPEPEMDDWNKKYYNYKAIWWEWQDAHPARRYGGNDADWKAYTKARDIYMDRYAKRVKTGRLKLEHWETPAMPKAPKAKA